MFFWLKKNVFNEEKKDDTMLTKDNDIILTKEEYINNSLEKFKNDIKKYDNDTGFSVKYIYKNNKRYIIFSKLNSGNNYILVEFKDFISILDSHLERQFIVDESYQHDSRNYRLNVINISFVLGGKKKA